MTELKPCPFCGKEAILYAYNERNGRFKYEISCVDRYALPEEIKGVDDIRKLSPISQRKRQKKPLSMHGTLVLLLGILEHLPRMGGMYARCEERTSSKHTILLV